jgi:translation initiation factor IF-2
MIDGHDPRIGARPGRCQITAAEDRAGQPFVWLPDEQDHSEGRWLTMAEQEIGRVTNYFSRIGVAVLALSGPLRTGDNVRIRGGERDFEQTVESMQVEHQPIESAEAGQEIAIKVSQKVRPNDVVYKVE